MSFVFGFNDKMMKLTFVDGIRIARLTRFCAVIVAVLAFTEAGSAQQVQPAFDSARFPAARRLAQAAPIPPSVAFDPGAQFSSPDATRPDSQQFDLPAQPAFNPSVAPPGSPPTMALPLLVRIKDITTIEGHRSNQLQGFGLVSGLNGTGGNSELTRQLLRNMLARSGILPRQLQSNSLSAVSVHAEIDPFTETGQSVTATVAVLDGAKSLYGGVLIRTSLKGVDDQVYATAEGPLEIGGFSAEGAAGSIKKNHATVGRVETTLQVKIPQAPAFVGDRIRLLLKNKDNTTAYRIAHKINEFFPRSARANDAGSVDVLIPKPFKGQEVSFVVMINNLEVRPDVPARVVINEKTGTIVIGQNVKISGVVFAKDNLIITTNEAPVASQPAPFSDGDTVVLPRTQLQAVEQGGRYNTLNANTTVGELASALNMLGVTPQDLISVFESIEQCGALHAELIRQ